jgi:hypothetical protein
MTILLLLLIRCIRAADVDIVIDIIIVVVIGSGIHGDVVVAVCHHVGCCCRVDFIENAAATTAATFAAEVTTDCRANTASFATVHAVHGSSNSMHGGCSTISQHHGRTKVFYRHWCWNCYCCRCCGSLRGPFGTSRSLARSWSLWHGLSHGKRATWSRRRSASICHFVSNVVTTIVATTGMNVSIIFGGAAIVAVCVVNGIIVVVGVVRRQRHTSIDHGHESLLC